MPHRPEEVTLSSVEVSDVYVITSSNPFAPPPSCHVPTPSSKSSIPSGIPIQQIGGFPASSGASVLLTTEPPPYEDSIRNY